MNFIIFCPLFWSSVIPSVSVPDYRFLKRLSKKQQKQQEYVYSLEKDIYCAEKVCTLICSLLYALYLYPVTVSENRVQTRSSSGARSSTRISAVSKDTRSVHTNSFLSSALTVFFLSPVALSSDNDVELMLVLFSFMLKRIVDVSLFFF